MEHYKGIKFITRKVDDSFAPYSFMEELNTWVYVLGELGLAPVHPEGAYGNHSCRVSSSSFVITCSGMVPSRDMRQNNYCELSYQEGDEVFLVKGQREPSSESFLHLLVYRNFPDVNAIMHGHSGLLNGFSRQLGLCETDKEFPYGTKELAYAAMQVLRPEAPFILMKNHGFVATGPSIGQAAKTVLGQYGRLIELLRKSAAME
ncbi:MAG: class II aldolase/adducin family protein [Desulfopila sp.]